ncbi:hypothetical protein [Streptosporangium sp. LJ11]|uniref:hypothetical protein n=1 Tax=Streptosporangium sp. LJ11 TaxID=3436927 RepID=UPI003F792CE7
MSQDVMTAPETTTRTRAKACGAAAWDCQTHNFLGSPQTVAENLAALPADLVQRRVFMLMIEGEDRAEARVFERFAFGDDEGTVATWESDSLGDMVTQLTDVLIKNRGVHCPGEQVKASLDSEREFIVSAPAPAPKTAAEAFASAMDAYAEHSFVRASVMVLC